MSRTTRVAAQRFGNPQEQTPKPQLQDRGLSSYFAQRREWHSELEEYLERELGTYYTHNSGVARLMVRNKAEGQLQQMSDYRDAKGYIKENILDIPNLFGWTKECGFQPEDTAELMAEFAANKHKPRDNRWGYSSLLKTSDSAKDRSR